MTVLVGLQLLSSQFTGPRDSLDRGFFFSIISPNVVTWRRVLPFSTQN